MQNITIQELLDRPIIPFHERTDEPLGATLHSPIGAQTSEGSLVSVEEYLENDSLFCRFYKPMEDGTVSLLTFGITREAAEILHAALSEKLQKRA